MIIVWTHIIVLLVFLPAMKLDMEQMKRNKLLGLGQGDTALGLIGIHGNV